MRIGQKDAKTLTACRYEAVQLQSMTESFAMRDAHDNGFDGMPKARGRARGLDDDLASEDAARKRLEEQERRYKRAKRRAMLTMSRIYLDLTEKQVGFIRLYFVKGLPFKAALIESGTSRRAGLYYLAEVKQAARGE